MPAQVLLGEARAVLATLEEASVEAIVTDPPYALTDKQGGPKGFMGQPWDNGRVAHDPAFWAEVLRVAKPGAFLLAFAGTRTYHRLACAIEDAGWECRDMIMWHYGSGFPKSKSCLKPAHEPILLAKAPGPLQPLQIDAARVATGEIGAPRAYEPRQDREQWRITGGSNGSGATSPAGRWPPNLLLSHHSDCQPAGVRRVRAHWSQPTRGTLDGSMFNSSDRQHGQPVGYADADGYESVDAWTCHPQCPIRLLDEQAGPRTSGGYPPQAGPRSQGVCYGKVNGRGPQRFSGSTGNCSRFFPTFGPDPQDAVPFRYVPKASRAERNAGCDGMASDRPDAHNLSSNACATCGRRVKANGSGHKCECGPDRVTIKLPPAANGHPTGTPY